MISTRTVTSENEPYISVRYSTTTPENHPPLYAYLLKVEVISSVGYPEHIFVFHRSPEGISGDIVDTFTQIASPVDVEEIPVDAPDPKNGMPYYRTKEVTLWFRTPDDMELAKKNIKDDIRTLSLTYDTLYSNPDTQEVETYGHKS